MTVICVTVNAFLFCHIIRTALLLDGDTTYPAIKHLTKTHCATPNPKTCLRAFPPTFSVLYVYACNTINHRHFFPNISHLLPQRISYNNKFYY